MKKISSKITVAALSGVVAVMLSTVSPAPATAGDLLPDIPLPDIPGISDSNKPTKPTTAVKMRQANFAVNSIYPNENTVMGVAQPIIIRLKHAPRSRDLAQQLIKVEVFNKQGEQYDMRGYFRWWSPTEVRWRPTKFWPAYARVKVTVGDRVRQFRIGARKVAVANDKTHTIKVYINNKLVRTVPTSMGKPKYETPNGFYYIGEKRRHMVMDSSTYGVPISAAEGYKLDVEYALRMSYSGIFLHAAPWSVGAQGRYNSSHGCLNVSTAHAKWFYENWDAGDVIRVINSKGGKLSRNDGMGDWADL
ncbi:MAG: L,D-transpeptidase [Lawsonella sp.]